MKWVWMSPASMPKLGPMACCGMCLGTSLSGFGDEVSWGNNKETNKRREEGEEEGQESEELSRLTVPEYGSHSDDCQSSEEPDGLYGKALGSWFWRAKMNRDTQVEV